MTGPDRYRAAWWHWAAVAAALAAIVAAALTIH